MAAVTAFFVGLFAGGVCGWCWTMCWAMRREADEMEAVAKQFDEGLSQSIRQTSDLVVRRIRQNAAVSAARKRPPPRPDPTVDDDDYDPPEPWRGDA